MNETQYAYTWKMGIWREVIEMCKQYNFRHRQRRPIIQIRLCEMGVVDGGVGRYRWWCWQQTEDDDADGGKERNQERKEKGKWKMNGISTMDGGRKAERV